MDIRELDTIEREKDGEGESITDTQTNRLGCGGLREIGW